ncbi:hypothetical protein M0R45_024951 [Rubus argutus]|uniref:Uncharacterized protein n=1 Tax=Rubus argutus TaxID=59490 RepID=A0AAW1WSN1_RUBAR
MLFTTMSANVSSNLVEIDLGGNMLQGGLPNFFQNFCRLESLSLEYNQFSQNMEDFVKTLSYAQNTLERLYLNDNRFGGSLPDLTGFSKLRELILSRNRLSGSVPESLGQLSSLQHLDLSYNQLNGSVPESVGQLSSLEYLDLSYNQLNVFKRLGYVKTAVYKAKLQRRLQR